MDQKRYLDALHAIQSGIAFEIGYLGLEEAGADSKHLRVGVNSAMVEHTALVRLLVEKEVFTKEEYSKELIDEMERERDRITSRINKTLNTDNIKLG